MPINPTPVAQVYPLDYTHPNAPTIKTWHGVSIVVNGKIIGRVQSWNPKMFARTGAHVYELNNLSFGRAVDYVPGKNNDYTISATRLEMWDNEFELALGFPAVWSDLIDQDHPFTMHEHTMKGNTIYRSWVYYGCWFTSRVESAFEAESDSPKVLATAEISFVSRLKTL